MTIVEKTGWHVLREVRPGQLWQIEFLWPTSTNCWLWKEEDGVTLIDAGMPHNAKSIMDVLVKIGQPLKRIMITHAHPDHAGAAAGISAITGAEVFANTEDIPFLQGKCMSTTPGFWMCRTVLKTGEHLGLLKPPPILNVKPINEGDTVGTLKVLHSPGHTPGSITLWAESVAGMFCGDNVCTSFDLLHIGLPWFTLDLKTQRASIRRYSEIPARLLLPGHGPAYQGDVPHQIQRLLR